MVITEPARPSARLLGLSLKLFPSTMARMLNEDLTRFTQTLCRLRQDRRGEKTPCWQGFYRKFDYISSLLDFVRKKGSLFINFFRTYREGGYGLKVLLQPMRCTAVKTKNQQKSFLKSMSQRKQKQFFDNLEFLIGK